MAELSTYARPYAKAAFQYALESDALASWESQLALLSACSQDETLKRVISSPAYNDEQRAQVLIDVVADFDPAQQNFVQLLARNNRLVLLPQIAELFHALKLQHEQAVDVQLVTAMELDSAAEEKLVQALTKKLSRKVTVKTEVDQRLLAGVVIKAGDFVIDASMRGRIDKLARAINS